MSATMTQEIQHFPMELCELLQTLSLGGTKHNQEGARDTVAVLKHTLPIIVQEDAMMFDDPSYQSDAAESDCSSTSTNSESYGCAYLRAIQAQLDSYSTAGSEYLEAIFTHREILMSYPMAHIDCARGFSDIAHKLEQQAWKADQKADTEAVAAFRHEAWTIAARMVKDETPVSPSKVDPSFARSPPVCVMQPAW